MGVDIGTYRARIGTFAGSNGTDVVTAVCFINLSGGLKMVGSVSFIGILLIIAGIETNPGPTFSEKKQETIAIVRHSFTAKNDDELTLNEEDMVTVIDTNTAGTGWLKGELNGIIGIFPKYCVEILLENPTVLDEMHIQHLAMDETWACTEKHSESTTEASCEAIMGVDIGTYRARIGTFAGSNGTDVVAAVCFINLSGGLKMVGSVSFIGILLIIAGIETNPGPTFSEKKQETIAIVRHSFTAKNDDELTLNEEDMVTVIDTNTAGTGWLKGELNGIIGIFPKYCVEILLENPTVIDEMHIQNLAMDEPWACTEKHSESTTEASCEVYNQSELSSYDKVTLKTVEELGLKKWFPGKLNIKTLITIDPVENVCSKKDFSLVDLPWIMLKRLLSLNCDLMDLRFLTEASKTVGLKQKGSLSVLYDDSNETESISPLDLFVIVFQCCDPMLKQLLFQKLYLCKLAVPFICRKFHTSESVVHVWPLRSIVIEIKSETGSTEEDSVLDMETKVVCFARFGRPRFSKSKLMNGILSNTVTDTFYNRDCPSGTIPRQHTEGYVEMFWLPTVGESKSRFDTSLSFLNMRGDMKNAFSENVCALISDISDICVAVCETGSISNNSETLMKAITRFSFVILLITNPLDPKDTKTRERLYDFENKISCDSKTCLTILGTHKGNQERNIIDIITDVSEHIKIYLRKQFKKKKSLETRLIDDVKVPFSSDENAECKHAEEDAKLIVDSMTRASNLENWVNTITPIQCMSKQLSDLLKQQYRNTDFSSNEQIKENINLVRKRQLKETTETIRLFMNSLIKNAKSPILQQYFLGWLKYFFEQKKRKVISKLLQQNQSAWNNYRLLKNGGKSSALQVKEKEMSIKTIEQNIESASFGLENLFREVGHLYDAITCLGKSGSTDVGLPPVEDIVTVIANLVSDGYVVELLDGNSFYMPTKWIQLLLRKVHWCIQERKVLALSVLGVQSSGKSTLLNTMFGSQYVVSSGRCTRGINAQLIPLQTNASTTRNMPFEYVLIIDTEGLRAPELSDRNYKRDNELSTIITGLGDTTILNIMGENTSEIHDILQITIHAFLRLKLVNDKLDIRKSCTFIHQNVTDVTACDKMKRGLQISIRNLDKVTEESAQSEGISDVTAFNHVIEFDTDSHVWYLPNLWQGNPPMARVNKRYSEAAVDVRQKLIAQAVQDRKHKSFKSIIDILLQTEDLWKGVLAEDFVFSFRNSLEKKAYIELEKKVKVELRSAENTIDQEVLQITQNTFTECDEQNILHEAKAKVILEMDRLISTHLDKTTKSLNDFFDDNNYIDTTIRWKAQTLIDIESYFKELGRRKVAEIDRLMNKREVDIMINLMHKSHEEELRKNSLKLANELRNTGFHVEEANRRFEQIWETFVQKSLSEDTLQNTEIPLKTIFIKCLLNTFSNHSVVKNILDRYKQLHETFQIRSLSGSFTHTNIDDSDISLKSKVRQYAGKIPFFKPFKTPLKISRDMLEKLFKTVDYKIRLICKKDKEIESRDIKSFLQEVVVLIDEFDELNADRFSLKITFKVKVIVHISSFACSCFETENKRYQNSHGEKARLNRYKSQVKDRFNAHFNERKAEDTAALLFRHAIKHFVRDRVQESLSIKVKAHLREILPTLKYNLILEILTSLAQKQSFRSFLSYILNPRSYAIKWLTKKAERDLFKSNPTTYSALASEEVCKCLTDMKRCMSQSVTKFGDSISSIEVWIQHFTTILKTYKLPKECFRDVVRELDRVENIHIVHFKDKLLENLTSTENELMLEFKTNTLDDVKWRGINPIGEICEEIWGCPDLCVFCNEPCIKGSIHKNNHMCLQHRPSGCKGGHLVSSGTIWLNSCNFDVASDNTGRCGYFKFLCNPREKIECNLESHLIRDYRKYLPNWDIEPTTDMNDKSKFWMWFIGKYKQDLSEYFEIIVTNVPASWEDISEEEALESLKKLYSRGNETGSSQLLQ